MLTDRQIKSLKKPNSMVSDGGGLYIRLSAHGSRTFVYRRKEQGKTQYVTLGEYPTLSLAQARLRASETSGATISAMTLEKAVIAYLTHIEGQYRRPEQVKQRLEKDIVPTLGKKRLSSISASDLSTALHAIVERGAPVSANRTLADVKHVFQYSFHKGWISSDPSANITRKVVGGKEGSREVVLTEDEIRDLIAVMRKKRFRPVTRVAMLLLLVTGQRSTEILNVSKDQINGRWWTIPETKNDKAQKVYLTHLALFLLKQVNFKLGGKHQTLARALSRMKVRYIPRDIRRTMSTLMMNEELGVLPHVAEKCLNHKMEGVMAVYNRAEFLAERKDAWIKWSKYLLSLS